MDPNDRIAQLERELAEREDVLSHILQAVPGGVVHVGPDGAVQRANPAACSFLGLSYDALTRRYTQDFAGATFHEDGRVMAVEDYPVSVALMTGRPAGPTMVGVRQPGGEVRWAVFRAMPLEGGGAVVAFLDITERKRAEEQHNAMTARMRATERLASLGRLAAGTAHEINNPLTYVLLNLERARTMHDPAIIDAAIEGAERVAAIVRDLSSFSRLEDDSIEAFPLTEAVDAALSMCEAELQHRARIEVDVPEGAIVLAHEGRTVQVLVNLLVNAAQAIEPGQRDQHRVAITGTLRDEAIHLVIEDTGRGMDEATQARALEPFFTTKQTGEGTGLGLSISHGLIMAMGGTLSLQSAPGRGTRVQLLLPRAPVLLQDAPATARRETPRARTVLVIDDQVDITRILETALAEHVVHTATTGTEALALLERHAFDLILCDLMMPDVTGMQLHDRLQRAHPQLIPRVVYMTGGAYTAEARAFVERPDVRCIAKPFRIARIRELLTDGSSAS